MTRPQTFARTINHSRMESLPRPKQRNFSQSADDQLGGIKTLIAFTCLHLFTSDCIVRCSLESLENIKSKTRTTHGIKMRESSSWFRLSFFRQSSFVASFDENALHDILLSIDSNHTNYDSVTCIMRCCGEVRWEDRLSGDVWNNFNRFLE